ncbi:VanZ family protein [Kitasatospora sp. NPDC088134]|uniref:VanZ family protein n=1 Tax=Kitasatospora sp. NPDC088134 TaxID=3364071 RepID=UPI0038224621
MHTTARSDQATGEAAGRPVDPAAPYRLRTAARVLLAVQLLVLCWLSLRPVPAPWTAPSNLTPLASVHRVLSLGGLHVLGPLAAGLLPLAPVGVLLPLAFGTPARGRLLSFLRTTGAAALLATALEFLEGWAPGHVLDVDDILLGTLGAALAHLLLVPPLRALDRHRAGGPAPAPEPESATAPEPESVPEPLPTVRQPKYLLPSTTWEAAGGVTRTGLSKSVNFMKPSAPRSSEIR